QIETTQLGGEMRVLNGLKDIRGDWCWSRRLVYEKELLLRADPSHSRLDHAVFDHMCERLYIMQQMRNKLPPLFGVAVLLNVLCAHQQL
ncbi:MAG TPA: hypothetical protein VEG60_11755, partial [Candidatus Binatia bacterium]|nr:hypothetical protein [Candidatus Binatia bacterium]